MNQDILLSKIVANSTDTTWSQAYTTLNVYIALSIEKKESKASITPLGKETLEKLQREFFALDDKNLENIKAAVGNVTKTIDESLVYSILVGAIVKDVLYLVVASTGTVVMKRGGEAGIIASSQNGELVGFSGRLKHDDIIVLQTGDFAEKIPFSTLQEYLVEPNILSISENITPLIHGSSKGTEAAIILQYKNLDKAFAADDEEGIDELPMTPILPREEERDDETRHENNNIEELANDENPPKSYDSKRHMPSLPHLSIPHVSLSPALFKNKRSLIGIAVVLLVLFLIGSIFFERSRQEKKARAEAFEATYEPSQKKFDESASLIGLNKSIALDGLLKTKKDVEQNLSNFPKDSEEHKKLSELLSQINQKIDEVGGGSGVKNQKELVKAADLKDIASITAVTYKGGELVIISTSDKKAATITQDGKLKKSYTTDEISGQHIAADEKFIYTLGDSGIAKIDKGNGRATTIVDDATGSSIDLFGSNVYVLSGNDVTKHTAPSYSDSSYFVTPPSFSSTPISMTINGPVWILESNGKINKFTKGKVEGFEVRGLLAAFGKTAQIYTDDSYSNLYVLDGENQRVVVFSDKGEFQTQYEWSEFKNANSFAIDEVAKRGYLVKNNILYSFDL